MELVLAAAILALGAALLVRSRRTDDLAALRTDIEVLADRMSDQASRVAGRLEGIDSRMTQTQSSGLDMARQIFDALGDVRRMTATVADQARELSSFQDLLKAPQPRGGVGEAMLEELLRQILPPQAYSIQHRFRSGAVVDAAVRAGGRLVSIDSKFPLSNYRRICEAAGDVERTQAERDFAADIVRHVRDIATRYIVVDEGTFDFAVMYVPAEGVYAEVLKLSHGRRSLFEIAIDARVFPMSPLTLYGYLQTILFGLKCLRIEESAQQILDFAAGSRVTSTASLRSTRPSAVISATLAPNTKRACAGSIAFAINSNESSTSATRSGIGPRSKQWATEAGRRERALSR